MEEILNSIRKSISEDHSRRMVAHRIRSVQILLPLPHFPSQLKANHSIQPPMPSMTRLPH
jgi:hypothetical protein